MCQTCVNDGYLKQSTYDKLEAFIKKYPEAENGPAHTVLGDDNVLDHDLKYSLGLVRATLSGNVSDLDNPRRDKEIIDMCEWFKGHSRESLEATQALLLELLAIPEDDR
jgi:hypothetical protein